MEADTEIIKALGEATKEQSKRRKSKEIKAMMRKTCFKCALPKTKYCKTL